MNQPTETTSTLEAFKAFVASQDPNQTIRHGMWSMCAVGAYVNHIDGYEDTVVDALEQEDRVVFEVLNNGGRSFVMGYVEYPSVDLSTYGKLSTFLHGEPLTGVEYTEMV